MFGLMIIGIAALLAVWFCGKIFSPRRHGGHGERGEGILRVMVRAVGMVLIFGCVVIGLIFIAGVAQAQGVGDAAAAPSSVGLDAVEGIASGFIGSFAKTHTWVATVLFVMGLLRAIVKPITAALESYLKATATPTQYGEYVHFEAGPVFKWINFALDFFCSIKLPIIAAAVPNGTPATVTAKAGS